MMIDLQKIQAFVQQFFVQFKTTWQLQGNKKFLLNQDLIL
jgi:hypothetical protein